MSLGESAKQVVDATAGTAVVVSWLELLPGIISIIAGALSVIWFALRIWESDTVREIRGKPPRP